MPQISHLTCTAVILGLTVATTVGNNVNAQSAGNWPGSAPVRVIVPFAPGGATDQMGRMLAQGMSTRLGKTFTVENHDGAGGAIGTDVALKAAPNGHTLLIGTTATLVTGPILRRASGIQREELASQAIPVMRFYAAPSSVIVNPAVPAQTVSEFIAYARKNPDKLFFGSAGQGSNSHLIGEYFKAAAGIRLDHIPFRGTAPAFTELIAGRVDVMFESLASALPNIQSGRVRALAVTTKTRSPVLPNVPTAAESGLENFEAVSWAGVFVPAGTPAPVVASIHKSLLELADMPDIQTRMKSLGTRYETVGPEEFIAFLKTERQKWTKVITEAGIKGG